MTKYKFTVSVLLSLVGLALTAVFYMRPPIHLRQPFLFLFYIGIYFWLLNRHKAASFSVSRLVVSSIVAFAWIYSSHTQALGTLSLLWWLILIATGLSISFTLYLGIAELERPFQKKQQTRDRRWILLYAAIPVLGWIPYFLAYYPAKMNADSFWQWAQAHRITQFDAWHPVLDTWIIQACEFVYNSPATYIVLQILTLAFLIALALYIMEALGMPRWLAVVLDLAYSLNPANGFLVITMWKDILFAASVLLLTIMLLLTMNKRHWLRKKRNMALFTVVAFLAMALRHNGPEMVLAAMIVFIIIGRGLRRHLIVITTAVLALFIVYTGPVKSYFHVIPTQLDEALAIPSQQIAATYKYHGTFTPQLKSYFDRILPAKDWSKDYSPYTVNPVKWDSHYNEQVIYASFPTYLRNWAGLLRLNPGLFVRAYMRQVAPLWQFASPGMHPYLDTPATLQSYPLRTRLRAPLSTRHTPPQVMIKKSYEAYVRRLRSSFGRRPVPTYKQYQQRVKGTLGPLRTNSRFYGLRRIMNKIFNETRYHLDNYLVKGALPFFLMILGLVASVRRFGARGLIVYLPSIFVVVTLALAMPATDFRYSFGFALSVPVLFLYGKLRIGTEHHGGEYGDYR